jgi:arylsulfatase A-like enzyme
MIDLNRRATRGSRSRTGGEIALVSILLSIVGLLGSPSVPADSRPNVLFIVLDDLNDWTGYLGRNPQARTPNIDRLAAAGVAFKAAYDPAPACNPSRAAVMSGLRPFETGLYENEQGWTAALPVKETLTSRFIAAGYDAFGSGKIFHDSIYRPGEWTEHFVPPEIDLKPDAAADGDGVGGIRFFPVSNSTGSMPDSASVDWAISKLRAQHERPFFLGVGLVKPHMPWAVPRKYFDRFPLDTIVLPPSPADDLDDVPEAAKSDRDLRDHGKILRSGRWKDAVQAYLASIAFADEQVGRLIDALDESAYRDNTIVVLWGDNGFHLGEKQHWRKFTLWEEGTHVPLIWKVPGLTTPGGVVAAPVDLTSIYATLFDLTGIAVPGNVRVPSLVPLLREPASPWDHAAIMTWGVGASAVRQDQWRYIRYQDGSEELYDHSADPREWHNLAGRPALASTKAGLAAKLPTSYAPSLPIVGRTKRALQVAAIVLGLALLAAFVIRRRRATSPPPPAA